MTSTVKVKVQRGSKNRKKAWRKVDVDDVDQYLEDKRLDERLGGPIQDRASEDLFEVDTVPSGINLELLKDVTKKRRKEILEKPPRCFQIIGSYSQVSDPLIKRNRVRTAEERKHLLLRKKEAQRKEMGILKLKERNAIENRQKFLISQKDKPKRGDVLSDIWNEADSLVAVGPELQSEWIEDKTKKHTLVGLGKAQSTAPKTILEKPFTAPTIETPHPGMSYNPTYGDHVELLQSVASKELKVMKTEKHLQRVTTKMFKKVPRHQAEAEWAKEMSAGVPSLDPEAAIPDKIGSDEDNEFRSINPPSNRNKKKTLKTRRKIREEKQRIALRLRAKQELKKVSDIHRLKYLKEAVNNEEAKLLKVREKRLKKEADYNAGTKRLGKNKFIEHDLEFNMPADLKGSLRSIQPEGNLLQSRFTSLQKRNMMEVPAIQRLRFSKKKRYTKPYHKLPWEINTLQIQKRSSKKPKTVAQTVLGI